MAQAQLRLPDTERPVWHDEGDTCPVPGCVGFYYTYAEFNKHWVATHEPYRNFFKCIYCGHITKRRYDARRHTFQAGSLHQSEEVKVVNSYYKPSMGKGKPRRKSHEERLREQEQERLAREEERKERIRLDREERRRKAFNEVVELYFDRAVDLDWDDTDLV